MIETQERIVIELLQQCLPHLDLAVSDHHDGSRLRRDICLFLAGLGYPGAYAVRFGESEKKQPVKPGPGVLEFEACQEWYRKVLQG